MDQAHIHAAAQLLWNAWQDGRKLEQLPDACRPQTIEEGYAVQARLASSSGQSVSGWKIAATSQAGQAHIGVDGPLAGRLLAGKIGRSPATLSLGANGMRVAELEFAFRLARDLPPRDHEYSMDEVMASVASLHPAIEVPDSRFLDFSTAGPAQLIADSACAGLFVWGSAATADWRTRDLATHPVSLSLNGVRAGEGCGANVLGDPRIALTWLANELTVRADGLKAGQLVTTGTCIQPTDIAPGVRVLGDFGPLGRVEATFAE
ncbi:MAG: hypothetical protein OXC18_00930 [Desulfurellaceae bacterium]|nr:hypothetical protein [Desulfurellaceae bacterium]